MPEAKGDKSDKPLYRNPLQHKHRVQKKKTHVKKQRGQPTRAKQ